MAFISAEITGVDKQTLIAGRGGVLMGANVSENKIADGASLALRQGDAPMGSGAEILIIVAAGVVFGAQLSQGGTGYKEGTTISLDSNLVGVPTTPAEFSLTIVNGTITNVVIVNGGTGYTDGESAANLDQPQGKLVYLLGPDSTLSGDLELTFVGGLYCLREGTWGNDNECKGIARIN